MDPDFLAGLTDDLADPFAVRHRQEHAARFAEQPAEGFAAGPDRRGIDDRQQFLDVLPEQRVIQRFVGVLQVAQEGIALEIGMEFAKGLQAAGDLLTDVHHRRGQQPMQTEVGAFGLGKSGAFVEARVGQQPVAEGLSRQSEGFVAVARKGQQDLSPGHVVKPDPSTGLLRAA